MKNIKCIAVWGVVASIAFLAGCSTQKESFEEQRKFVSLAGPWHTDLGIIHLPGSVDQSGLPPRNADTLTTTRLTRLHPYVGVMEYVREVDIPGSLGDKMIRLVMERTKPSTVWVDGDSVGRCNTLLSSQIYDLSKWLTPGKHELKIRIDNRDEAVPLGVHGSHAWTEATQTNWNGVIGRLGLEISEKNFIEQVQVVPDVEQKRAVLHVSLVSGKQQSAVITVEGYAWNATRKDFIRKQEFPVELVKGRSETELVVNMGEEPLLWSEFSPALYKLNVELLTDEGADNQLVDFGMKSFGVKGTQFTINGKTTFLRGKHDGCVFPLTGYPSTEVTDWLEQFRIAQRYGINHIRFHSWTPPVAAFKAADIAGVYLQPELPFWGTMDAKNTSLNQCLLHEGEQLLKEYGNSPSFTMMALGNELNGDINLMRRLVNHFRSMDNRHLYSFGSNNNLGTAGEQAGEDFFVTCRVGRDTDSTYATHVRSSFSFADAWKGGILNGTYPSTRWNYAKAISNSSIPVVSHENGQFQVYPDYKEINKYTGVLYPYNYEVFRRRLADNHLEKQALEFHRATAAWSALCYKADIEMCMRTPGMGGFQLLDLIDYPGQGSALVGLMDVFWKNKGGMSEDTFAGFCNKVVPMAEFKAYCWSNEEEFQARLIVANYDEADLKELPLRWKLETVTGKVVAKGEQIVSVKQGVVESPGEIRVALKQITQAAKMRLALQVGTYKNAYDLWVYPATKVEEPAELLQVKELSATVLKKLNEGANILYFPQKKQTDSISVGGLVTPDYWNYAMFKGISEWAHKEVSPGTMSLLVNAGHALFKHFPTDTHTNWQWWEVIRNSRAIILDALPAGYLPVIQVIDNVERNHKLGLVFEFRVGKGKLVVCSSNVSDYQDKPEGRAFYQALMDYVVSDACNPQWQVPPDEIKNFFQTKKKEKQIIEVRNITDYDI